MALKYAFKLIFLEGIFEFAINRAPPTQTAFRAEKNALSIIMVKDLNSHIGVWEGVTSYPGKLSHSFKLCKFFSFSVF